MGRRPDGLDSARSSPAKAGHDERGRGRPPAPPLRRFQLATMAMPKGVAPAGSVAGDDASSVSEPPLTVKPLTEAIAASTTYRWVPATSSRASNGRIPVPLLNGVLVRYDNEPFDWIR